MAERLPGAEPAVPTVQIAHDVLGDMALLAAREVQGVSDFALGEGLRSRSEVWARRVGHRPVRVEVRDREVEFSLYLVVEYGVRIPEVAQKVQESVKRRVEDITGLTVKAVDIHIQGVAMPHAEGDPSS
ncbi:MAG: Asp23/Gls24 family envelope stress response protein [Firmicutes bacterium]|nr:Asp23/Gls24 family envelope stress response protein [Bacillota bacterium]